MGQPIEGWFETEGRSLSLVLAPWIAFVAQSESPAAWQALGHAVAAVWMEMQAVGFASLQAQWCLGHRRRGTVQGVLPWQHLFRRDMQQAIWHWEQAAMWLPVSGDPHQGAAYAVLYAHARTQQCVAERGEVLWRRVVALCQQEGSGSAGEGISSPPGTTAGEEW